MLFHLNLQLSYVFSSTVAQQPGTVQEAIKGLQAADKENIDDIIIALQYLTLLDSFEDQEVFEPLSVFLEIASESTAWDAQHVELQRELSKCIAEVTKGDVQRVKFTDPDIIKGLLRNVAHLSSIQDTSCDSPALDMVIQACRALGNICYMNEEARTIIGTVPDGDQILLRLLDKGNDNAAFYKVRCGLISNYLLGEEAISKRCLEQGQLMEQLDRIVGQCATEAGNNVPLNEDLLMNVLPPLSILTENVSELNFDEQMNRNLALVLAHSQSLELGEMCLELLHYQVRKEKTSRLCLNCFQKTKSNFIFFVSQAENDDVKLVLAKCGVCQTIFELLEKHKDRPKTDDARAVMKLACDLIVLILTGDAAMDYLHATDLVANMSAWLQATDNDLIATGVLALGNFARTDSHCIEMVQERGLAKELLAILGRNSSAEGDMKLQHALLSTLRNLVIPRANKGAVIEAGLVDTVLPMLLDGNHQPPVVFKLLGTLRMVVDGQEQLANEMLRDARLIGQLVQWSCSAQDMTGGAVTGESLRLMAWLVKHAYLHKFRKESAGGEGGSGESVPNRESVDVAGLKAFAKVPGAMRAMVEMLTSQHMVMQNESLVALTILASFLRHEPDAAVVVDETLIEANVGLHLAGFMQHQHETMTKEIVDNLKTLLAVIGQSERMQEHLRSQRVEEELKNIPVHVEYCTL